MTDIRLTSCPGKTINESHMYNLLNIEEIMIFYTAPVSIPRKVPFTRNKNSKVSAKFVKFKMTCN